MNPAAHYKRLVLELCHACRNGDETAVGILITPDFTDDGEPTLPTAFAGDLEILGLVGEGRTVVLRMRQSGTEQIQFFEGRDGRLAARRCYPKAAWMGPTAK
jgi:hypothetical protein